MLNLNWDSYKISHFTLSKEPQIADSRIQTSIADARNPCYNCDTPPQQHSAHSTTNDLQNT